ncbi:MAG: hypothetical protein DWQ04_23190 [Chloroflexi bacterium]|nr:MAG: hypothetical protein DWQ04_23190 [Chloroflexota bacterium]
MADVDGNEVGRMLYDGYGGVLTSTVPITLTGAVADVPDATTGLVYQGGGRWYDPALGRPLQPNAVGGPPTIPQALNRFAATPIGQPGVYQAELSSWNPFTDDNASNIGKALVGNEVSEAVARSVNAYYRASAYTILGEPIMGTASYVVAKSQLAENVILTAGAGGYFARDLMPSSFQSFGRSLFDKAVELNSRVVTEEVVIGYNFSYGHRLPAGRLAGKLASSKFALGLLDLGVGFGIDVGYQALLDANNPHLSNAQKFKRAVIVQGGGSVGSYVASSVVFKGAFSLLLGSSPPGWAVTSVGILASIAWDTWGVPKFNRALNANPIRNLAPLSN